MSSAAAAPFLDRLQAAFAQVQSQASTPLLAPIVATVVVGLLTLILVARVIEDHMSKGAETFYPTKAHSRVLSYKLVMAALGKGKKWQRDVQRPGFQLCDRVLSARLPLAPRQQHVADMVRVCELPAEPTHLPIIYPAVLMVYPNCLLFAKAEYPFPAMGSVHVSNFTKIYRPLPVDEDYPAEIKVEPVVRPAKKGTEVTFVSTLHDKAGELVWSNSSTFLVLHKRRQPAITPTVKPTRETQPEEDAPAPLLEQTWALAADMGRRYAAVSKDNNPIHTMPLAAKAFGFPGVIMHGMYLLLRAAAECQALAEREAGKGKGKALAYPVEVTAKFIRPVVLPHKVQLRVSSLEKDGARRDRLRYEVRNKSGKIAMEGTFQAGSK